METANWNDSDWPAATPERLVKDSARREASSAFRIPSLPGASPSVRYVYACLLMSAARSSAELQACSGLPARTVRYAVQWLVSRGHLNRLQVLGDTRKARLIVKQAAPVVAAPQEGLLVAASC